LVDFARLSNTNRAVGTSYNRAAGQRLRDHGLGGDGFAVKPPAGLTDDADGGK
jgi:hypothetical protein